MSAVCQMTPEEYLEFEKTTEVRHEFVDGQLYAMAGETLLHDDIVLNIVEALRPKARAKGCKLHATNIQTKVRGMRYRYPDIVISCEVPVHPRLLEQPCFIAEVQSDSTAETDNGVKLEEYTKIPSLERYAIVAQKSRQVVLYKRKGESWEFEVLLENGEIDVPCLGAVLSLEQIYAGLEL
ncbi:MAG: Uma2 family endonuclease [Deinococcales bacterium]